MLEQAPREVLVIPRTSVEYSSYGTSVFVLQPRKPPEGDLSSVLYDLAEAKGPLTEAAYAEALARNHRLTRAEGIDVAGPIGADTLIQRRGFDAYVVMLHDQGHVAAKLLAPQRIAGLTIGTPVLFSSVAHGSALDIAGQGRADPAAMVEAITRLVARRRRAPAT